MTASAASLWLLPAILAILVLASAWVGVRWYYSEYLASLAGVPMFASLGSRRLRALARAAARQELSPGADIVTEGGPGDGVYVLERGWATVTVRGERVTTMQPGGYVGEMAVIDGGVRSATITVDGSATVLHLPASSFRRVVERDPVIARAIEAELADRLRDAGASVPPRPSGSEASLERLSTLSRQLRTVRHVDWGNAPRTRRRRFM